MLRDLSGPRTITSLWESCRRLPTIGTFQRFVLVLDLLYLLGAIELKGGMIVRVRQ